MEVQQSIRSVAVPSDGYLPLVWVEAEQLFVARGYVYRVGGNCEQIRDSEEIIARLTSGGFVVLSSRAPSQINAAPPRGWQKIEPAVDLGEGKRLGDIVIAVRHGANEYTVVNIAAGTILLAQNLR